MLVKGNKPELSPAARTRMWSVVEILMWVSGISLSGFYAVAIVHAQLASGDDIGNFRDRIEMIDEADQLLWSDSRKDAYRKALAIDTTLPEALLRIPAIDLEVPVWEGTDEVTLNRAVGRVAHTAPAGESGNTVVAGHRDGFFRELGELKTGDRIEVQSLTDRHVYVVKETMIVEPDATHLMDPSVQTMLTLITCYPFYFVGPAPQRFVVRAIRDDSTTGGKFDE